MSYFDTAWAITAYSPHNIIDFMINGSLERRYGCGDDQHCFPFGHSFSEFNNNELYLHDHTSTYSVAKAIYGNQNFIIGQLRYFDNN